MNISPRLSIVSISECANGSLVRRIGFRNGTGIELVCETKAGKALLGIQQKDFTLYQCGKDPDFNVLAIAEELFIAPNLLGYFEPRPMEVYETPGVLMLDDNGWAMNVVVDSNAYMSRFVAQLRLPGCVLNDPKRDIQNSVFFGVWKAYFGDPESNADERTLIAEIDASPNGS